jgi:hypothetical protein
MLAEFGGKERRENKIPYYRYLAPKVFYRDFIGPEVSVSNTTPEDIAQAGIKAEAIEIYKA